MLKIMVSTQLNLSSNKCFVSKKVQDYIDVAFSKYSSTKEADKILVEIWALPEVVDLINITLIFDVIQTFHYKLDRMFMAQYADIANGDYKFVIDHSITFINLLHNLLHTQGAEQNKKGSSIYSALDMKQLKNISVGETAICVTFLQAFNMTLPSDDGDEVEIIVTPKETSAANLNVVSPNTLTRYKKETLIQNCVMYEICKSMEGKVYLKLL